MLQKKDKKAIVKLLNSDSYTFQNRILQMILFASATKRKSIYNEISSNAFLKSKFMGSMYRGTISRFDKIRYCYNPELSDREAIEVACDLIAYFDTKIEKYLVLRKKYEQCYLNQAYSEALRVLDCIDTEVCASLWSCGQRFLIKQMSKGLEGNKRELSELSDVVQHNFLAKAVLFFYSCMAEVDMSYENYQAEVLRYLGGMESLTIGRYLSNKIDFDAMLQYGEVSLVVQIDCQCSIIDAYNSVEKYLPVCLKNEICTGRLETRFFATGVKSSNLFNNLATLNAEKQTALLTQSEQQKTVYTIIENYTMGKYAEVLELSENYLKENPTDVQVATLYCKSLIFCGVPVPNTVRYEYIKYIYSVYSMDVNYREAVLSLKQEAKKNHGLVFGQKLFSFLVRKRLLVGEQVAIFASCTLDPVIHPNFARFLWEENLYGFEQYMRTVCPCSISLAVARQNGNFESATLQSVDKNRLAIAKAQYLCECKRFDEAQIAIAELSKSIVSSDVYMKERIDKILLMIYREKESHDLAIRLLVDAYFINEFLFERLNACEIYRAPKRIRDQTIQRELYHAVYLFLVDPGDINQQLISYNNYLDRSGFSNIIDALSVLEEDSNAVSIFFFANVCTIGLLKRDVTLHMLTISPEEARVHILSKLIEISPRKKYASEINTILTAETIKGNINTINKSKIYVDTDKILLMHRKQWEESYKKYLALADLDELVFNLDFNDQTVFEADTINLQRTVSKKTTQKIVVFNNIIKQIESECLFSVQYGLETYLSSRIRHGYCKGQLTSFLREHHLLSMRRSEDSDEYFLNDYWESRLSKHSSARGEVNEILSRFTKSIEEKIDEVLKTWLRIKQEKQTTGMFDYSRFSSLCAMAFVDEPIKDFAVFYNRIVDAFWEYTELILKEVRERINTELTEYYISAIDLMETSLQKISKKPSPVNELVKCCNLAKPKIISAMRQFAEVFSVDNTPYNDFTMSDLTASCRRTVEKVHTNSAAADWTVFADDQLEFRGKFFASFVDILCILLNNAIDHSGISEIEELKIGISICELDEQQSEEYREIELFENAKKLFEMRVTNSLSKTLSHQILEEKLAKTFETIRGGVNAQELIQSEGGSGLYKLCNTAQYNIEAEYLIGYEIEDDAISFSYCFVADKLICEGCADDNLVD